MVRRALSFCLLAALCVGASGAVAQKADRAPAPKAGAAKPGAAPAAAEEGVTASELQPQTHASNAGVSVCFDTLARASSAVIDTRHEAFSMWDKRAANERPFRSIVALNYPAGAPPRGAGIIINAPGPNGGCDSTAVQVLPSARSCSAIQTDLMKDGKAVANLTGLALIRASSGAHFLLLPTAGGGCAVTAVTPFSN